MADFGDFTGASRNLDTSLVPQGSGANPLATANPIEMMGRMAATQNMLNTNAQFQQMFRAKQALGPMYQQAIDPETGQLDTAKLSNLVRTNPDTAFMAPSIENSILTNQHQQLENAKGKLGILTEQNNALLNAATSASKDGQHWELPDIQRQGQQLVDAGVLSPPQLAKYISELPQGAALDEAMHQHTMQLLGAKDKLEMMHGQIVNQQTNGVLNQYMLDKTNGRLNPALSAPMGMSDEQKYSTAIKEQGVVQEGQRISQKDKELGIAAYKAKLDAADLVKAQGPGGVELSAPKGKVAAGIGGGPGGSNVGGVPPMVLPGGGGGQGNPLGAVGPGQGPGEVTNYTLPGGQPAPVAPASTPNPLMAPQAAPAAPQGNPLGMGPTQAPPVSAPPKAAPRTPVKTVAMDAPPRTSGGDASPAALLAKGTSGQSPQQAAYAKSAGDAAAEYEKNLNDRITTGGMLMQTVAETRDALKAVQVGGKAEDWARLAQLAQGFGLPDELVNRLGNHDLAAGQEVAKLSLQNAVGQMKQQLTGVGGSRVGQMMMGNYIANNPNMEADPKTVERIFNFWSKIESADKMEQSRLVAYKKAGGDMTLWPAEWQKIAEKEGIIDPRIVTGEAVGSTLPHMNEPATPTSPSGPPRVVNGAMNTGPAVPAPALAAPKAEAPNKEQAQETKQIGGKTYYKINGQWHVEQ